MPIPILGQPMKRAIRETAGHRAAAARASAVSERIVRAADSIAPKVGQGARVGLSGADVFVRSARTPAENATRRGSDRLSEAFLARLDSHVDPLGRFSDPAVREARQRFYSEIYGNPGLQEHADRLFTGWVSGGDGQSTIRKAFVSLGENGGRPRSSTEELLQNLLETRRERWTRLASRFGEQAPDTFHLFRGVRGEYALEELVSALEQPGRKAVTLSNHTVASWTTDVRQARRFADAPAASLIYEADIPIQKTLADKWVDGSAFVTWCADQDEVVVAARNLDVSLERFEATFRGKTYTAAQRDELVRDWRAVHPATR